MGVVVVSSQKNDLDGFAELRVWLLGYRPIHYCSSNLLYELADVMCVNRAVEIRARTKADGSTCGKELPVSDSAK